MPTIPEALAIAIEHQRVGRLRQSETIYRQILAADPNHHDAWHLLGLIASQVGHYQAGAECIQRALALRPDWAERTSTWQTPETPGSSTRPLRVISERCD